MSVLRREEGTALVTTIIVISIMLTLGVAMLSIVDTQTRQTRAERSSEAAFDLAEATLNAQAFLLGRNWPTSASQLPVSASPAAPCSGQTISGTLADPPASASPSLHDQIQSMLAQTYRGPSGASTPQWWVTTCEAGGRDSWDASLLTGRAYDPSVAASPSPQPRRMWVRAEAHVDGHRAAVVALVQAGQASVFPPNLAVVTGTMGADLTTTTGQLLTGGVVGPLLSSLTGGGHPMIEGPVGLRCSLLDQTALLGCLSGLFKATSMTTVAPLLQANDFVDFRSDSAISADQLTRLRQQAQASGTYYGTTSGGVGTVASGASCLPAGSAGKIVFIEKVGDGTGACVLSTSGNPSATALVVGSGGVRVQGGGTFTGVIYALHRTALAGGAADVRVEGGSKVVGAVFADDNPALASSSRHGVVSVIPPPINMTAVLQSITSTLGICQIPLLGPITCNLTTLLGGTLDAILSTLGISASTLANAISAQLTSSMPAIRYDDAVVRAAATFGDSATVSGTFRQVSPSY